MTRDDTAYTNPIAIKFEFVKKIKVLAKKIQSRTILIGPSLKYTLGVSRYIGHNGCPDFFFLQQYFRINFQAWDHQQCD